MDGLLIVSGAETARAHLFERLGGYGKPLYAAATAAQARRAIYERAVDIAVIDTPLQDEFGHELAAFFGENGVDALLLVKSEIAAEVGEQAARSGGYVLEKPLQTEALHQTMRMLFVMSARIRILREENESLRRRIDEIRLIERAKARLMERRGISEAHAHRYIEKQSMDQRVSKARIAEKILKILS